MEVIVRLLQHLKSTLAVPFLALGLVGCATAADSQSNASNEPALAPVSSPAKAAPPAGVSDILRVRDEVSIDFKGAPNPPERHAERIKEDGTIAPPIIDRDGPVKAAGLTRLQLEQELEKRYKKYYKNITVTVHTENRMFYVTGEVRAPGRYPYTGEMSVLKAITTAGGFTDFAKKSRVQLSRTDGKKSRVDCLAALKNAELDLPVHPDDVVFVPRRYF
jgi:polysaccharide export outer membrane protein